MKIEKVKLGKVGKYFLALVLCGYASPTSAGIMPSFSLEESGWHATNVMVVTEGDKIDGEFTVLESWKGKLKAGESISVPSLAAFEPQQARSISYTFTLRKPPAPEYVTGSRMVLFLKRSGAAPNTWQPVNRYNDMKVSVVWVEEGKAYSFQQPINPGRSVICPSGSEEDLKAYLNRILQVQTALTTAAAITDPARRAKALQPFTASKHYYARESAFTELSRCGKAALPVLRALLKDQELAYRHGQVIEVLAKAGGVGVGGELTAIVEAETVFWSQAAPKLKKGWWNGTGLKGLEAEHLRTRYSRVLSALRALEQIRYKGCEKPVILFRDFWRSLPQLEDKSGLDQMSEACDSVLHALRESKR